jgi:large subunit ribosomal protein L29
MKIKEIREKNKEELKKKLSESRNNLTKIRLDISSKQVKNHREIRKVKKEISRILTVLKSQKA